LKVFKDVSALRNAGASLPENQFGFSISICYSFNQFHSIPHKNRTNFIALAVPASRIKPICCLKHLFNFSSGKMKNMLILIEIYFMFIVQLKPRKNSCHFNKSVVRRVANKMGGVTNENFISC
jgi:hypothetical protein